jgi:hypothetical protein
MCVCDGNDHHWFTNAQGVNLGLHAGAACPVINCGGHITVPAKCRLQHRQIELPSGAFTLSGEGYVRLLTHARLVTLPAVALALGTSTAALVAGFKASAPTGGRSRDDATLELVCTRPAPARARARPLTCSRPRPRPPPPSLSHPRRWRS